MEDDLHFYLILCFQISELIFFKTIDSIKSSHAVAMTILTSFLQESFSLELTSKWLQPLMNSYDSRILDSRGYQLVSKGFRRLITDPTFKVQHCLN